MVTLLFWNLDGQPLGTLVAEVCAERAVDVVVLAECETPPTQLATSLGEATERQFFPTESSSQRLQLLTSLGPTAFRERYVNGTGRLSLRTARFAELDLLLAIVHLKSELFWDRRELSLEAIQVATELRQESRGVSRRMNALCVVGDFNLQPFEDGMVADSGFFGMMARSSVLEGSRQIQSRQSQPMYNPMWSCFGDRTPGPPGTFYRRDNSPVCFDWHLFDQVLYADGLIPYLENAGEIIGRIGQTALTRPDGRLATGHSKHLPILFSLALTTASRRS